MKTEILNIDQWLTKLGVSPIIGMSIDNCRYTALSKVFPDYCGEGDWSILMVDGNPMQASFVWNAPDGIVMPGQNIAAYVDLPEVQRDTVAMVISCYVFSAMSFSCYDNGQEEACRKMSALYQWSRDLSLVSIDDAWDDDSKERFNELVKVRENYMREFNVSHFIRLTN
ncbi:hypothetical protein [Vibrio panuliri]|uniref:Antirestriction protein n=1 Tax=Vibrio panuliri TaxID=1381081 RepID=A0ABX3FJ99_9VIBR|nr:hypothetical protein [Vibrio panuliri]KAB1460853.1 hypothetical protein F7O85_00315 [Vibrio panuliri]OLQ91658.1 hypothetical protein BIY20_09655 [Vibrio panuliri]